MNFDLTDEQREIKDTAKQFFADRFRAEKVRELAEARTYDDGLTKQMAELGWPGIAISEDDGGQGLGLIELVVLLEESGFACAPGPLLGSAGAALVISAAGSFDCAKLRICAIDSRSKASNAWAEAGRSRQTHESSNSFMGNCDWVICD